MHDGRPDLARIDADGKVHVMLNRSRSHERWIRVQLTGVKSLKLAQDAEVEMKAGELYREASYTGVPLLFQWATPRCGHSSHYLAKWA